MVQRDLLYTKDHEWIRIEDNVAVIGITNFAQSELGEIVFVDLPPIGKEFKAGEVFCVVESTKAASDVYAPVSGKVMEVNAALTTSPEVINSDPYANWLIKLSGISSLEISSLLDSSKYSELIGA